jgi:hypothetical protein
MKHIIKVVFAALILVSAGVAMAGGPHVSGGIRVGCTTNCK